MFARVVRVSIARRTARARRGVARGADARAEDPSNRPLDRRPSTLHRFYVDEELRARTTTRLSREETRHAFKALRLRPGVAVEVCDGVGRLALATLGDVLDGRFVVDVEDVRVDVDGRSSGIDWDVACAFAGLKGGRGDWLVEKCAELGARRLVPLLA